MRERKDALSSGFLSYNIFVNQLYLAANANRIAWNIPASAINAIVPLLNKWNTKWAVSGKKQSASTVDRTATNTARKNLTKYLRPFIQVQIMRNPALKDADIIKCGLRPYKKTKTKRRKPKGSPFMTYVLKPSHNIDAFYRQTSGEKGAKNRGKPLHVAFCKVAYFIGEEPPAEPEDYTKTVMTGHNGLRIKFKATDAGKKVTFIACWVSISNIDGPWCRPQSMYVP
jgi:hypothetical protein